MHMTMRWRIFLFYLVFGFLPLIALSAYSLSEYARTVSTITERQVIGLLERVSDQTNTRFHAVQREMDIVAETPEVQLAFVQFLTGPRMFSLRDKLESIRQHSDLFTRIALFSRFGAPVAGTGESGAQAVDLSILTDDYARIDDSEHGEVVFYRKVYDYQDNERFVGVVSAHVPMSLFFSYFSQFDVGFPVEKSIFGESGGLLHREAPSRPIQNRVRLYSAKVEKAGWSLQVRVPETELFAKVNRMWLRNILFALLGAMAAATAALYVSRRMTAPIDKIIMGTREIASGNLDYQIHLEGGNEMTRLADAIDHMAAELRQRQEELAQSNRLASLGLLSAGIAHEIKNPLAGLKTAAQAIRLRAQDDALAKLTGSLEGEVDRLTRIVTDLLDFARPRQSNRTACPVEEVIDRGVSLVLNEIKRKRVTVEKQVKGFVMLADRDQMVQVVLNLLLNALAALPEDTGIIRITAEKASAGNSVLKISDNGCGISAEDIDKIFDPFYSRSKKGTGLGLSVVYSLLQRNGMSISVESTQGEGTTITITFPTMEKQG